MNLLLEITVVGETLRSMHKLSLFWRANLLAKMSSRLLALPCSCGFRSLFFPSPKAPFNNAVDFFVTVTKRSLALTLIGRNLRSTLLCF
jgi:hypothetical protein